MKQIKVRAFQAGVMMTLLASCPLQSEPQTQPNSYSPGWRLALKSFNYFATAFAGTTCIFAFHDWLTRWIHKQKEIQLRQEKPQLLKNIQSFIADQSLFPTTDTDLKTACDLVKKTHQRFYGLLGKLSLFKDIENGKSVWRLSADLKHGYETLKDCYVAQCITFLRQFQKYTAQYVATAELIDQLIRQVNNSERLTEEILKEKHKVLQLDLEKRSVILQEMQNKRRMRRASNTPTKSSIKKQEGAINHLSIKIAYIDHMIQHCELLGTLQTLRQQRACRKKNLQNYAELYDAFFGAMCSNRQVFDSIQNEPWMKNIRSLRESWEAIFP